MSDDIYPIGFIRGFKSNEKVPDNWHKTDGSILNIAEYPKLFEKIGNNFGGDDITFNLPTFEAEKLNEATVPWHMRKDMITNFAIKIRD